MHNSSLSSVSPISEAALPTTGSVREIRQAFRVFIHSPEAKPYRCARYGTKYPGRSSLLHFVIYALLRRQDPRKCSHDPASASFQHAMSQVVSAAPKSEWGVGTDAVQVVLERDFQRVISPEQWQDAVQWWRHLP